jgi:hypothetical protein
MLAEIQELELKVIKQYLDWNPLILVGLVWKQPPHQLAVKYTVDELAVAHNEVEAEFLVLHLSINLALIYIFIFSGGRILWIRVRLVFIKSS